MRRMSIEQTQLVGSDKHKTCFIEPSPARTPKHLQDLIGPEQLLGFVAAVRFAGQSNAPQREINARSQSHGRHHYPQLPPLG